MATLEHGLSTNSQHGLVIAAALGRYWYLRGYWTEGRTALERAIDTTIDAEEGLRAKLLMSAGVLARSLGDYP